MDVLKMLRGECARREHLVGMAEYPAYRISNHGSYRPMEIHLHGQWRRRKLFNRKNDPNELSNCVSSSSEIRTDLYALAVKACRVPGATDALMAITSGHFHSANAADSHLSIRSVSRRGRISRQTPGRAENLRPRHVKIVGENGNGLTRSRRSWPRP